MRAGIAWIGMSLVLSAAGVATWSLTLGQEQTPGLLPAGLTTPAGPPAARPARDPATLAPLGQQMYLASQRGADWLLRTNRPDGRFDYGYLPALKTKMEGDHYLRQVGAAFALARAARLTGDERFAAVARQSLLTLLLDTATDDISKHTTRHTTLPSMAINRLGSAGLLVLAINELPGPADDLLDQSEQLCNYIRQQQQADGSLCYTDDPKLAAEDPDGINYYPGEALHALMRSQQHRPAAWKTEAVRKALAYYQPWWRKNKNMAFVPWQTAAYAEAYLATKEQAFADAVYEMTDWVCTQQYTQLDPRRPLWIGGFMSWDNGQPVAAAPQVGSAVYAEGLADACRVARQAGDLTRYQRYREALERSLQFLATLQYTDGNTQHFADWYRPRLVGGFYASHQDGNLRIDYAQHAICAMAQYVSFVCE